MVKSNIREPKVPVKGALALILYFSQRFNRYHTSSKLGSSIVVPKPHLLFVSRLRLHPINHNHSTLERQC
ncbi:hypothetical protein QC762_0076330 [Podospora pseudocomata]|uniref:Uncharacterized protein n=1 Tax=Podospora pseudocomata TaxID=2093779 RepID=A0ABR0GAU4_9PEZI|nr:hypothetical protein QC762_0076330 [Podospora pseudocomata]